VGLVYFVPTPIGNLKDITLRALEVLEYVDIIFAEDTRNTKKLLNHYNIKKTLKSYHKDNENFLTENIFSLIKNNKKIAVVSDAGTPCISDPGSTLVKELITENIDFEVLPGANAILPALIKSGFPTDSFYFKGFLNHNKNRKKEEIEKLTLLKTSIIIYESPHRIKDTLRQLLDTFSPPIAVCRELTKIYEERVFISSEKDIENLTLKGEFVIVVNNNMSTENDDNLDDYEDKILSLKKEQFSNKDIVKIMQLFGYKRNKVYKLLNKQ